MPSDPPDAPVRKENEDAAHVARTAFGTGARNSLAFFSHPITTVKVVKLGFYSDHRRMCEHDADWRHDGNVAERPAWEYGKKSKSISHTKTAKFEVEVELDIYPRDGDATPCTFTGTSTFGGLTFTGDVELKGGAVTFRATSSAPLAMPPGALIEKFTGDINWKFTAKSGGGSWNGGSSWGHLVYATVSAPIAVPEEDAGSTTRRMAAAFEFIQATKSSDPHQIVDRLMSMVDHYTLDRDPAVPAAYKHPSYVNTVGGAWGICSFHKYYAECQAIVRWVRALISQVGCPGTADLVTIYVDPLVEDGTKPIEKVNQPNAGLDSKKVVNGENWYALLVDSKVELGKTYNIENDQANFVGVNRYEACLRFTHNGTTKYYGGGAGVYATPEDVTHAFYALIWAKAQLGPQKQKQIVVREIVRKLEKK